MGDEHRVDPFRFEARLAHAQQQVGDTQAAIYQQTPGVQAAPGFDDRGIAGTAAAKAFESQHGVRARLY